MKKLLIILIIVILTIGAWFWFYFQSKQEILEEAVVGQDLENLDSIILKNTNFEVLNFDNFSFQYPDWQKLEIDPILIWPKEIAEKQEILLYLTNIDGVKMLVTKREVYFEELAAPFPLIFRRIFEQDKQIMEEKGGLTYYQITDANLTNSEIILEIKAVVLSNTMNSISKMFISRGHIYTIGINASELIFENYRLLADYILDSIKYY